MTDGDRGREALAAMVGRSGVIAVTSGGDELRVTVGEIDGDRVTVLAPRLKVGGMDEVALRFSVQDHTWQATLAYESAEYYTDELARVVLVVRSVEPLGSGVRAARDPVRAEGMLRVIAAKNVLPRNSYPVHVEDVSATGLRFTCEFEVAQGDTFTITASLPDRPSVHVRATAVGVERAAFGRRLVRARIERPGGR